MNYRAVCFDFDYTLGDATDSILAGYRRGLACLGWPEPEREAVRHTVGMTLENGYTHLTGDRDPEHRAVFRKAFLEVAHPIQSKGIPLFPGAEPLLLALAQRKIPAALVSTKQTDTLEHIMAANGLAHTLAFCIGGDLVAQAKPDPQGLKEAARRLNLPCSEILFCGDTVIDAETACRAGCDFCAVLNGTTPQEDFASWPTVHVAPDLWDLKDWLGL